MMCENCKAFNARVIMVVGKNGDRYVLCPRCLKILNELDNELNSIVRVDEQTSSGHIVKIFEKNE